MRNIIWGIILVLSLQVNAQNWSTFGGNNQKNGISKFNGPVSVSTPYWTASSSMGTACGYGVFTFGDKFATSRMNFYPTVNAQVELRNLTTGALIWSKPGNPNNSFIAVGFTEDAVYAFEYETQTLYALNVNDGSIKWTFICGENTIQPVNTGLCFADDGDPVFFNYRLNRIDGSIKWENLYIIPVKPDGGYVMSKDYSTFYHWQGYFNTPKKLMAINANTGDIKYYSNDLPGDADQENDLIIGPDGTIYITRDGNNGSLYAFTDNGTGFVEKWKLSPGVVIKSIGPGNILYCAKVNNGFPYGKLMKVDGNTGQIISEVTIDCQAEYITIGADSTVYVSAKTNSIDKIFAFTYDLQTIKWELNAHQNGYNGCPIGKEGVMVTSGGGTELKGFKRNMVRKPVADFRSSGRDINLGTNRYINYFDQSSYNPTSWQWFFEGGTPNTSTQQNPTNISYSTAGIYQVKLIASNAYGSDTIIRTKYVFATGTVGLSGTAFNNCSLGQNYPNPFSASSTINFGLTEPGYVTIKIMDLFGKEVRRLSDNQYFEAGNNEVVFAAEGLTPGIYLYTLMLNNRIVATKKMTIMK